MHIAHLVNPFHAPEGSEHAIAQAVTFESIRRATERASSGGVEVTPVCIAFPEDLDLVGPPFIAADPLDRSVIDIAAFRTTKKFPLIGDLLSLGARAIDRPPGPDTEDLIVYTNMDISLQPGFYTAITELVSSSRPAHVINRRTIPGHYISPDQIEAMCSEPGERHGGWDCFAFPRSWIDRLRLEGICIGAPYIGLAMLANLDALSGYRLAEHKNLHLTFHIGNDATWRARTDLSEHNRLHLRAALDALRAEHGPAPADSYFERIDAELFERPQRTRSFGDRLRRLFGRS